MKRKKVMFGVMSLLGVAYLVGFVYQASAAEKKKLLRVGAYDSRGIIIAYVHSDYSDNLIQKVSQEKKQAEAKGNRAKVKELDEKMNRLQLKRHKQGFGTAPVHECFEPVKDQIPDIAKAAGVDVIVSKWEFDYLASDAEVVDVTMELAALFEPSDSGWKSIKSLKKWKPYSHEELERLEKERPH